MQGEYFSIANRTRGTFPRIPFAQIKDEVLGARYTLSLAFVSEKEATRITLETKKKDKASNVLSFPLAKDSGEVIICPATSRAQAPLYGMTPKQFLGYLFIHGCLHLRGDKHGATMEREERRLMERFDLRVHD